MPTIIHDKPPIEKVIIEASDGTKTITRRKPEKIPTPHLKTGYRVTCPECSNEHELEVVGPWYTPKLSFYCDNINWGISYRSPKGQDAIKRRIQGEWTEEHIQDLMVEMRRAHEEEKGKKRRLKTSDETPETPSGRVAPSWQESPEPAETTKPKKLPSVRPSVPQVARAKPPTPVPVPVIPVMTITSKEEKKETSKIDRELIEALRKLVS